MNVAIDNALAFGRCFPDVFLLHPDLTLKFDCDLYLICISQILNGAFEKYCVEITKLTPGRSCKSIIWNF